MVLATDLVHMMDDPGGPSHINFDEPVSTFDTRYLNKQIVTKTGDYTATVDDNVILCDANGAAFTITLPAASGNAGLDFHVKKIDDSVNAATIDGDTSETIDGDLTVDITAQYESLHIVCDGSNWHVL